MKRLLPFLFLCLLCACQDDDDMLTTRPEEPENKNISYLALGDSYTIGTSVDMADRWPIQLARELADDSITVTEQRIVATNGWTTSDLINGINTADINERYDLVSLLIGVNNQYQGQPLNGYQRQFEELLQTAIGLAGGDPRKVFVVSIPDYAFTPFGGGSQTITDELLRFNAAANFIADDYEVLFLNITPISQRGLEEPNLVANDNLHPSGEQYRRWVDEVIKDSVLELLE